MAEAAETESESPNEVRRRAPVPKEMRRLITKEELAKHNTENDCWISVHNLVLNLTRDFLDEHPGGPDVITCLAGKDCTQDFEDIAHSDTARDWASKYIVGYREGVEDEAVA